MTGAILRGIGIIRKVLSIQFIAIEMTMIVGTSLVWQLGLKQPWFKGLKGQGRG